MPANSEQIQGRTSYSRGTNDYFAMLFKVVMGENLAVQGSTDLALV